MEPLSSVQFSHYTTGLAVFSLNYSVNLCTRGLLFPIMVKKASVGFDYFFNLVTEEGKGAT